MAGAEGQHLGRGVDNGGAGGRQAVWSPPCFSQAIHHGIPHMPHHTTACSPLCCTCCEPPPLSCKLPWLGANGGSGGSVAVLGQYANLRQDSPPTVTEGDILILDSNKYDISNCITVAPKSHIMHYDSVALGSVQIEQRNHSCHLNIRQDTTDGNRQTWRVQRSNRTIIVSMIDNGFPNHL